MKFIISNILALSVIMSLAFVPTTFAQSVVPVQFENQAGNTSGDAFNCQRPDGIRAQTIYLGSQVGEGTILSFAVRGLPGSIAFGPQVYPNMTVKLSTTDKQPGGLSSVFANNIGTDETTVFQGAFISSAPDCEGLSVCPFAQPIQFETPFLFDPVDGNLLVEILLAPCNNPENGLPDSDALFELGENAIQLVFANDQNDTEGILVPGGVITQFGFATSIDIPTLSGWGLIAMAGLLGIIGFIVVRRRHLSV